jgi:hypothetical protein
MGIFVAAFSGSLRNDSYHSKLVRAFQELAPAAVRLEHAASLICPFSRMRIRVAELSNCGLRSFPGLIKSDEVN